MNQEVSLKVNPFYHRGDLQTRENLEVFMNSSTKTASAELEKAILTRFAELTEEEKITVLVTAMVMAEGGAA